MSGPELVEAVPFILEEAATAPHHPGQGQEEYTCVRYSVRRQIYC